MKTLRRLLFFVVVAWVRAALPFAQEASDLKPDPAAHFGTLSNGLRYVVRPNTEPKGRAALRLVVLAGSFNETEQQRGLAHYLEHMAFNGSTHYAPDTLVEFFQRMGMSFGGDTNAFTSFDRTVYMLDLPDTKPATLAEGLQVFADYAGGLLLPEKQIEKERPIILAEKRARDSVEYRTWVAESEFTLGGTLVPAREPIGREEIVSHAQRGDFVDLYNTWYRPDHLVVVAVGDFDAAAVEKLITDAMSPLAPRAPARPEPNLGKIVPPESLKVLFHPEAEAPATTVSISAITPYAYEPDTIANRLKYLPRDLAVAMLNRRLEILAKKEGAPFTSATASVEEHFDLFRETALEVTCKPDQWTSALGVADQELRRALEFGFEPAELKEAVANSTNSLDQAVKTASTRRSDALAGEIVERVVEKNVFTPPAEDQAIFAPALAAVTPETCAAALRESWSPTHRYLIVTGNTHIEGDAVAAITAAYRQSQAVAVTAPAKTGASVFAYTDFGPAGRVVQRRHIDDLDLTLVEFANGVRLNFKKTDFEANRIRLGVRVGTGQLTEPRDQPGLATFASSTFTAGGLGQHSADDLERILAGKTVGVGFRVAADALAFNATTDREDLLLQLQLFAAYLTDPGYRSEALRQARKSYEEFYNSLEHTPDGPLQTDVARLLASGDPRFGLPPRAVMLSRTLDEVKAWLAPQLAAGAIEIAIAGDLEIEPTIAAVARTLGALPARAAKPPLAAERAVAFPAPPFARDYRIVTQIPKGIVALYWPTADASDVHRTRRLTVLGEVLSDRLRVKVREELGEAYSPGAGNLSSDTYTGYGYMVANVTVDPAQAQRVADVVAAIADDLQKNGVSEDELTRAKQPLLTSLRESARTNQYWLGAVLAKAQEKPEMLDWCRSRLADVEAISKADIDQLAHTYLAPARVCRAIVLPAPTPSAP